VNWTVRLSAAAEKDFAEVVDWTVARFGAQQAEIYAGIVAAAIKELHAGPDVAGAKPRDEIGRGIFSLHVARRGKKARHVVIYRAAPDQARSIDVVRILHDAMDLPRHLPAED
jgi:toxin ParE1/3/4